MRCSEGQSGLRKDYCVFDQLVAHIPDWQSDATSDVRIGIGWLDGFSLHCYLNQTDFLDFGYFITGLASNGIRVLDIAIDDGSTLIKLLLLLLVYKSYIIMFIE